MAEAKTNRILMLSDVHLCHLNWFGMTSEQRLDKMVRDLNDEYRNDPYDMILSEDFVKSLRAVLSVKRFVHQQTPFE